MKPEIKYHPNGKKSYQFPVWEVRWSERDANGKSLRKTAWKTSKDAAESFLASKTRDLRAHGNTHATITTAERAALVRFREWQKTTQDAPELAAVIEAAIKAHGAAQSTITVNEAASQRLEEIEQAGLSEVHRYRTKGHLDKFAAAFGNRRLASITVEELSHWLQSLRFKPTTFHNYALSLSGMFALAVNRDQVATNPVAKLKLPKIKRKDPAILEPSQMRRLLAVAHPEIVPSLIVQAFCGVRRAEAERLVWENIKLDGAKPYVELSSAVTKTSRRRTPPIPENAAAWLRLYRGIPKANISLRARRYQRALEAAAKAAGIAWESNALRHSFGTYRLSTVEDAAKVSLEMGNSPSVIEVHYKNVCSPEDAKAWFEAFPEGEAKAEKVLVMKSA